MPLGGAQHAAGSEGPAARPDYKAYIASDEWRQLRRDALLRSSNRSEGIRSPCCEVCGRYGAPHKNSRSDDRYRLPNTNGLQVHHVHYSSLGREQPNDLIVLCTNALHLDREPANQANGCHERVHEDPAARLAIARVASVRPY